MLIVGALVGPGKMVFAPGRRRRHRRQHCVRRAQLSLSIAQHVESPRRTTARRCAASLRRTRSLYALLVARFFASRVALDASTVLERLSHPLLGLRVDSWN